MRLGVLVRLCTLVGLILLRSTAVLAAPADSSQEILLDLVRMNPEDLLIKATAWINTTGFPQAADNIAWALTLVLFASQAVRATGAASGQLLQQALIRLAIGGTMLTMAPTINLWIREGFVAFYDAGSAIWVQWVQAPLLESLTGYLARVSAVVVALIGGSWLSHTAVGGWLGLGGVMDTLTQLLFGSIRLVFILLATVLAMFMVLQFTAGMMVYLAQIFTPLVAAGIVHPLTQDWVSRWLRQIIHAWLLVLLVNVLFGLAVHVGFVLPIERQNAALQQALVTLQDALQNPAQAVAALKSAANVLMVSLLFPVTVVVGLVFGVVALWQAESRIGAFIGALAAGVPAFLGPQRLAIGARLIAPGPLRALTGPSSPASARSSPPSMALGPRSGGIRNRS
jgi:hypothetical protein